MGGDGPSKHEVRRSAGITNTCHTTEESQAIVVTPPKVHLDSLGCITASEWGGPSIADTCVHGLLDHRHVWCRQKGL